MRKISENKKTKRMAGVLTKTIAGTTAGVMTLAAVLAAVPVNVLADEVIMEWREENGVKYWYENGVRQGVKYNADGSIDISYRGKEIYDPSTEAWYWLDCVQNGAVAKNKDVYQESAAGQWGAGTDENGEKVGKWVRYDANGHMVKGWQTTEAGTYYFDPVYGTMAKGDVAIDGQSYYFNKDTGILERSGQTDDDGNSFLTDGWHKVGGVNYWYENGVRQGVKYNADGSIDTSYRGKEIYDPSSAAWYWLDCVQNGAVAKNKDVYQESAAGQWGAGTNENGEKVGKWVRYDANGHMVKGWSEKDGNRYYFDLVYGTMAKGTVSIDGKKYEFDSISGKLVKEVVDDNNGSDSSDDKDDETENALSKCTVVLSNSIYDNDGTEKKPKVTILKDNEIVPATEYTVRYSDNVNIGTATVTITANDNSTVVSGDTSKTFSIIGEEAIKYSGEFEDAKWSISESGRLRVTGSVTGGKLWTYDYGSKLYPWNEYRSEIKSAYINVSGLEDLYYLFSGCKNLSSIDLSDLDTGNVTDMSGMFNYCENLSSVDVSGFDTSNVTDMSSMFSGCENLSSVDVSGFDTSNVTNMSSMFSGCSGLSSLDVSGFNTSKVTYMGYMFSYCRHLSSIDVSGFDTSNVTYMGDMFEGCSNLSSVNVSGFDTSNVTYMGGMFSNCDNLSSVDVSGFDTSKVTHMGSMFYYCRNLSSLDVSGFDTSNVTGMSSMFEHCRNLSSLDVSGFNTSKVTYMGEMFSYCSNLSSIDVSGFDTSNVTDMGGMFSHCSNLSSIDVSGFDTSKVIYMSKYNVGMFSGCRNLSSLDLSGFDTSNVTNMMGTFEYCSNLTEILVGSGWDTSKASTSGMFFLCGTDHVTVK